MMTLLIVIFIEWNRLEQVSKATCFRFVFLSQLRSGCNEVDVGRMLKNFIILSATIHRSLNQIFIVLV